MHLSHDISSKNALQTGILKIEPPRLIERAKNWRQIWQHPDQLYLLSF